MNVYRLAVAEQDVIVLSKAYSLALNRISILITVSVHPLFIGV